MQKNNIAAAILFFGLATSVASAAISDAGKLFQNGEQAFKNNDFEVAASRFAEAVKLAPQDTRTRFRYGQSLFSLSRYSESMNQFQTVLANSPNNIIARIYLCENLVKMGRPSEAEPHLNWILKIQPGHIRAAELLNEIKFDGKETVPEGFKPLPLKEAVQNKNENEQAQPVKVAKTSLARKARKVEKPKKSLPPSAIETKTWDVASFIAANPESFMVNLEYARYSMEKGDLKTARERLAKAEKLAKNQQDTRRFLEVQILTSLVYVYEKDYLAFGKHLMKLKPLLSEQSYQSFLDIYNQAREMKNEMELTRLAAGVAMGAGHYAVASNLLKESLGQNPGDELLLSLLAEAQMQNLDYTGAESTLSEIARKDQKNAEAYFNLGRFYLTASYNPEMAKKCSEYGKSLRPDDPRFSVLLALLDYSEGKIDLGVARLRQLLPQVEDPSFKVICQRIIDDGRYADQTSGSARIDFAQIMALPGASHAPKSSYRILATDYLKRGSFFTAMRYFFLAQDLAEVGRTYLGMSSALHMGKEDRSAAIAAGYGLRALNDELSRNPESGRANLYLALYHFERDDFERANQVARNGLVGDSERNTRQRLTALLETMSQPEEAMKKN